MRPANDEGSVVTMVGAALQDPASVDLRAHLLRGLAARVRQDPVVAAELARAPFGG